MISIIIPHVGPVGPLIECIGSVLACIMIADEKTGKILGPATPFELVVVADKPEEKVQGYLVWLEKSLKAKAKVTAIQNLDYVGMERAFNQGLEAAKGEYLCYLMSDVKIITPGAFGVMVDVLDAHPEFGWVALSSEHTGFLAGGSMFTRAAYQKVGAWSEEYESGGGFCDDDYLRRMWQAGFTPHIVKGPRLTHVAAEEMLSSHRCFHIACNGDGEEPFISLLAMMEAGRDYNRIPTKEDALRSDY